MHDKIILRVNNLGKCFKIYSNPWRRALEWASFGKRTYHQSFWALQNISFEVRRGEFLGIIGQNGAGKSTLLKILSGVLQPTTGTYHINGRVLSMLELGMDFNPYLTGRENVIRNTELLGFPDDYVRERMEQIAQFSELGEFFDRPVGLYSTGMSARLAFSLYAFLDCDVLILDEVLAVGDLFFRQKCFARLEELITNKTTIIIVAHDMGAVRHYCDHVIVLNKGQKMYGGESRKAVHLFHQLRYERADILPETFPQEELPEDSLSGNNKMFWPAEHVFTFVSHLSSPQARLTRFAICNQRGEPCVDFSQGDQVYIFWELQIFRNIGVPVVGMTITNQFNVIVYAKNSLHFDTELPLFVREGNYIRSSQKITVSLQPGEYVISFSLHTMHSDDYACLEEMAQDVSFWRRKLLPLLQHQKIGYFKIHLSKSGVTHWGMCDLPGEYQVQVAPKESCSNGLNEGSKWQWVPSIHSGNKN